MTGNLRAAGSEVAIKAVGGYARITGADITSGPEAKVSGALTIRAEDPASITVPVPVWRIVTGFPAGAVISGLSAAVRPGPSGFAVVLF